MYDSNKLLPKSQFQQLVALLPTPKQRRMGRKRVAKEALVQGILQVLINGVAWGKIAQCGCSYVSCYRYFKELQRRGVLKLIHNALAKRKVNLTTCAIDTTLVASFEFKAGVGFNGQYKTMGSKISLMCDLLGLPADAQFGKGNQNDKIFLAAHLDNTVGLRKKILNLDMSYMNLEFRRIMRRSGVRVNMQVRKQDFTRKRGPKFKFDEEIYKQRIVIERTNAWVKAFRRLRLRREYHFAMFKAFVFLALIIILIRYP